MADEPVDSRGDESAGPRQRKIPSALPDLGDSQELQEAVIPAAGDDQGDAQDDEEIGNDRRGPFPADDRLLRNGGGIEKDRDEGRKGEGVEAETIPPEPRPSRRWK